jgi:hypothetical protein
VGLVAVAVLSALTLGGLRGLYGLKVYAFWMLVPVVLVLAPFDRRDRDRLVTILMATGAITAAVGLAQQVVGHAYLRQLGYEYDTDIRFAGGFLRSFSTFDGGPFPFGYFLAVVLVVGSAVALADRTRLRNQLFLLSVPLLVAGQASAVVRGAWLLTGVGLLWLVVTRHRRLVVLLPWALVALVVLPGSLSSTAFSSDSTVARTEVWDRALEGVVENPLGAGIGTTGGAADRVARFEGDRQGGFEIDNQYLLVLYELGAPGLLCLVLLLAGWHGDAARTSRASVGTDAAFASGVAGVVLGAAAASVMSSLLQISPIDAVLWLLVGTVAGISAGGAEGAGQPVQLPARSARASV